MICETCPKVWSKVFDLPNKKLCDRCGGGRYWDATKVPEPELDQLVFDYYNSRASGTFEMSVVYLSTIDFTLDYKNSKLSQLLIKSPENTIINGKSDGEAAREFLKEMDIIFNSYKDLIDKCYER